MTDLERLLHLASKHGVNDMTLDCDPCREMIAIKSKLNEKLEKVCDFPLGIEQCAEHGKETRDLKQQIKQLKDELQNIKYERVDLHTKIQSLKSQLEKYVTQIEFWKAIGFTEEEAKHYQQNVDKSFIEVSSEIYQENISLKSKNEKLQKVIDEIRGYIKTHKSKDSNYIYGVKELKSILKESEK